MWTKSKLAAALALALTAPASPFAATAQATHDTGASPTLQGACAFVTLAYGPDATAASIEAAGETDCYRFEGAGGDRVRVRVIRTAGSLDARASVARPDGTTVCGATGLDDSTCVLDAVGTHKLFVRDAAGSASGDYRVSIQRLGDPVGCAAHTFGTGVRSAWLVTAGESDCWRFTGTAGDRVGLRLITASTRLDPRAEILHPDGRTACAPSTSDDRTCVLSSTGAHTILVADAPGTAVGSYVLGMQRLNDPVGCSALSFATTAVEGSIAATGETDCWRLTGAAGDRVRIGVVDTPSGTNASFHLLSPAGEQLCASSATHHTCRLGTTGTHTILVREWAPATWTGAYRIGIQRLNDPVGCSSSGYGPSARSGSISAAAQTDCWRFAGAAGDRVRLRAVPVSGAVDPVAEVVRPDGTTLCQPTAADETTCVLDTGGDQAVLVSDSSGTRTGDYRVAIQRLNSPVGCGSLSYGTSAVAGTIGGIGASECWRVTGAAGDRVSVDATTTWGALFARTEVVRPDGVTDCPPGTNPCVLDVTGEQTIHVTDLGGTDSGGYVISIQRLNLPVGCSGLAFGVTPATGSIGAAGEHRCWRFDGAAGDRVRVRAEVTAGSLRQRVQALRPNGTTLCDRRVDEFTCVLDVTGTHTLLVSDDDRLEPGTFAVAIQRVNNPVGCSALAAGSTTRSSGFIAAAAVTHCWRVTGTAGQHLAVRLAATSGTLDPTAEVIRPDGSTLCWGGTDDSFSCSVDADGTYAILVGDDTGLNTGRYEIWNPPVITSGTITGGG